MKELGWETFFGSFHLSYERCTSSPKSFCTSAAIIIISVASFWVRIDRHRDSSVDRGGAGQDARIKCCDKITAVHNEIIPILYVMSKIA
jgi:hypothetical protein